MGSGYMNATFYSSLTRYHAAYSAGRNSRVSAVATIRPPMMATAIGPQNIWRESGIIASTAAAAVLAMIPLSRQIFWGPMAVAIMGGLIVATALTLLFLPALYAAWYRVKEE